MKKSHLIRASLISITGLAVAMAACSPGTGTTDPDGGGAGTGDGDNPGTGSTPGDGDNTGGDGDIVITTGGGSGDGDGPRETECEIDPATGMEVCTCIKLATWGALGTFGAVPGMDGTDAITAWLNANSTGEADYTAAKPAITAEYLANYDVIILQDLSAWPAFTAEEIAAFDAWLAAGGGAISLNGYSANGLEMTNVNALLASSGMSYVANSDTFGTTGGTCGYCYGNSIPQGGWTTHPIGANITNVGAFHGRSITPGAAEIVAQDPTAGVVAAAATVGEGRVFMFHDEWVTYNSQWTGQGIPGAESCTTDPNNSCYGYGPASDYQSAQFWFNSIKWASGDIECFDIDDVTIVK